jgi:hypothetical protein
MDEATKYQKRSGFEWGIGRVRAAKEIGGRGLLHHHHHYHCMLWKLSAVGGRGGGWISSAYGEAEAPLGTE